MNAVVFQHVPVTELPDKWRASLSAAEGALVTVRIEQEAHISEQHVVPEFADMPLFGMWRDREDMDDVAGYIDKLRAPRFIVHGKGMRDDRDTD